MEGASPEFVLVPYTELTADLLRAVIESFVLREGTDYGDRELSLDEKVARMMAQLKSGEANIVFDPESESVTILPAGTGAAKKHKAKQGNRDSNDSVTCLQEKNGPK